MTLDEFRTLYTDFMVERVTDPKDGGNQETATLEAFINGNALLPASPYFRDPVAYILQRDRVKNRFELFDAAMSEWFIKHS